MMKNYSNKIGELIANNRLEDALNELTNLFKNSPKLNEVILQASRYNDLKEQIRLGTISYEDKSITKNRLIMAVLELTEELESIYVGNDSELRNEIDKHFNSNKSVINIHQNHSGTGDNIGRDKIIKK